MMFRNYSHTIPHKTILSWEVKQQTWLGESHRAESMAGHGADPRQSLAGGSTIPQAEADRKTTRKRHKNWVLSASWNPGTNWSWTTLVALKLLDSMSFFFFWEVIPSRAFWGTANDARGGVRFWFRPNFESGWCMLMLWLIMFPSWDDHLNPCPGLTWSTWEAVWSWELLPRCRLWT